MKFLLSISISGLATPAIAQEGTPNLFTNVNVFDGVNEELVEYANVVVTGNLITEISTEALAVAGGTIIDGGRPEYRSRI